MALAGTRLRKPWAKLDFDFFEDESVMLLEKRSVKDAYAWCKLIAIWADFPDARIDMADEGVALKMRQKLRMTPKSLDSFFGRLASLGLIDADFWRELSVVTNERAASDALARSRQRSGGSRGGSAPKG